MLYALSPCQLAPGGYGAGDAPPRASEPACASGGSVIWTRHRRRPDLIPAIREWFANAGFEERELISPGPDQYAVGWHQQEGNSQDASLPTPLFTFVR